MSRRTGLVWHELFMRSEQGKYAGVLPAEGSAQPAWHCESPDTHRRLKNLLDASGYMDHLIPIRPRATSRCELLRVHADAYLARLEGMHAEFGDSVGHEVSATPGGVDIAKLAAGGCIEAVDAIMSGKVDNAYALVRPGGHHAERDSGKGLCVFANPSIAAAHALEAHGLERLAIVDIAVHHGNGAETIWWHDPRVLTISVHQAGWFPPNSGAMTSRGAQGGFGTNINIPLPPGSGIGAYLASADRVILPALRRFRPQLLLVPCGFDAAAQDPLGRMMLDSHAYRQIMARFVQLAAEECQGRLLVTHEGGYNENMVPFLGVAVLEAMSGIESRVIDPHREFFSAAPGQQLQLHQLEIVSAASALLNDIPTP